MKKLRFILLSFCLFPSIMGCNLLAKKTKHTVTFYDFGKVYETQQVKHGGLVTKPKDPVIEGSEFLGWYDNNDDKWVFNSFTVQTDIDLVSKRNYLYSVITLDANGGTLEDNKVTIVAGSSVTLPTPRKDEHRFEGWYYNDVLIEDGDIWQYEFNVTLVAQWHRIGQLDVLSCNSYSDLKEEFFNKKASNKYRTITQNGISSLDYLRRDPSWSDTKSTVLLNCLDTLVSYDEFGILRKGLAQRITHNEDYTSFTFKVRNDVPWVDSNGNQYEENGTPKFVSADDFVLAWNISSGDSSDFSYLKSTITSVTSNNNNEVTYNLSEPTPNFLSLLTHFPFMPVYSFSFTGNGVFKDSILSCGPYYISSIVNKEVSTEIYLKASPYYWNKTNEQRLDGVRINYYASDVDGSYSRAKYESGSIDSFSLSQNDSIGWYNYITGPNNTGTIDNPYNEYVDTYLYEGKQSSNGSNFVLERSKNAKSRVSYSSFGNLNTIKNTERALRLVDVRKAILAAIDYPVYFKKYSNGDETSILARAHIINSFVPRNYIYDDNGNEYTKTYLAQALANNKGITLEQAQEEIKPATWEYRFENQDAISELVVKAITSILKYNNDSTMIENYGEITFPINIEYFTTPHVMDDYAYQLEEIESLNKRLNGITEVDDNYSNCSVFKVVPTNMVNVSNVDEVSGSYGSYAAYDFALDLWGWYPEYEDPIKMLEPFKKNGDWSSIFGYFSYNYVPNIVVSNNTVSETDLLGTYTSLINAAKQAYNDQSTSYTTLAEAEIELCYNLGIFMPIYNPYQNWSFDISKSVGFNRTIHTNSKRFTNAYILANPLNKQERAWVNHLYDEAKADALTNGMNDIYS